MRRRCCSSRGCVAVGLIALLLLFTGCGGGGGGQGPTYRAAGVVKLPAGSTLQMADLKVMSCLADTTPAGDGTFGIDEPDTGPVLAALMDKSGHMVLMGFVDGSDASSAEISAKSTATALLFEQICAYTVMPSAWKDALAVIAADPHTDDLAAVIAARVAADPSALESADPQIRSALVSAAEAVIPASKRSSARPLAQPARAAAPQVAATVAITRDVAAIQVTSLATQSGILVGANPDGDGIIITNYYRRHVYYWVYVTGYQDAAGQDHTWDLSSWEKVTEGYLSATNGLAGIMGSAIDSLWDNVAYKSVKSPQIDVTFNPRDANKMYMSVVTAGAGSHNTDLPAELQGSSPFVTAWATGKAGMQAITFVKDFMMPAVFTFVPANALSRMSGRQLTDFSLDVIGLCAQSGADAGTAIAANDFEGALKTVIKGVVTDAGLRQKLGEYIAAKALTKYTSAQLGSRLSAFAAKLQLALKLADIVYLGIDYVAVCRDCAQSDTYNYWAYAGIKPPVRLVAATTTVHPGFSVDLTAYKGIDTPGTFSYRYTTPGLHGHLTAGGKTGTDIEVSTNTVTYVCNADAKTGDTETVKVVVGRDQVTDAGTRYDRVGEATLTLNVAPFVITIDPPKSTVTSGTNASLTAQVDGAVSTEGRIWYHWHNTATVGHLQPTAGVNSDDYLTNPATTTYVPGTAAGDDTITVEAIFIDTGNVRTTLGSATASVHVNAAPTPGNVTFTSFGPEVMDTGGQRYVVYGYLATWYPPADAVFQEFLDSTTRHGIPWRYMQIQYSEFDTLHLVDRLSVDANSNYYGSVDAIPIYPDYTQQTIDTIIANYTVWLDKARKAWAPGVTYEYQ